MLGIDLLISARDTPKLDTMMRVTLSYDGSDPVTYNRQILLPRNVCHKQLYTLYNDIPINLHTCIPVFLCIFNFLVLHTILQKNLWKSLHVILKPDLYNNLMLQLVNLQFTVTIPRSFVYSEC